MRRVDMPRLSLLRVALMPRDMSATVIDMKIRCAAYAARVTDIDIDTYAMTSRYCWRFNTRCRCGDASGERCYAHTVLQR